MAAILSRPPESVAKQYHQWWYSSGVWQRDTNWKGIRCCKSPSDMWLYQEVLCDMQPSLVVEFGTRTGASAMFFAAVMREMARGPFTVLSVDISHKLLDPVARQDPDIEFVCSSSTDPGVAERIRALRDILIGPVFAILDSDHARDHVLAEMKLLRPLLAAGDYLIVEDAAINGHPVLPGWGPGPFEAIQAYEQEFPGDYRHDRQRERKFGWTQATNGFLIRQ
jgi:cephalosporin hydroxylase